MKPAASDDDPSLEYNSAVLERSDFVSGHCPHVALISAGSNLCGPQEMPEVLGRLRRALRPSGVLYTSFKRGEGEEFREGRLFNDYTKEALEQLLVEVGGWQVLRVWSTADVRSGREVLWVNLLARRT